MEADQIELILQVVDRYLGNISGDDVHDEPTDMLVRAVNAISAALSREHNERLSLERALGAHRRVGASAHDPPRMDASEFRYLHLGGESDA